MEIFNRKVGGGVLLEEFKLDRYLMRDKNEKSLIENIRDDRHDIARIFKKLRYNYRIPKGLMRMGYGSWKSMFVILDFNISLFGHAMDDDIFSFKKIFYGHYNDAYPFLFLNYTVLIASDLTLVDYKFILEKIDGIPYFTHLKTFSHNINEDDHFRVLQEIRFFNLRLHRSKW